MSALHRYLLSVVVAAMITSIVLHIKKPQSTYYGILRLLCGMFLSITVLNPFIKLRIEDILVYRDFLSVDAQEAVSLGESIAQGQRNEIIKQRIETYILDEARLLGASLEIHVVLDEENLGVPEEVELSGNIAPLAKLRLSKIIAEEIGIAEEDQRWIG